MFFSVVMFLGFVLLETYVGPWDTFLQLMQYRDVCLGCEMTQWVKDLLCKPDDLHPLWKEITES